MAEHDGGAAFPGFRRVGLEPYTREKDEPVSGMSLRDYFAAKAMAEILVQEMANSRTSQYDPQLVADHAYVMADEMIIARTAKSPAETQRAHLDTFGAKDGGA